MLLGGSQGVYERAAQRCERRRGCRICISILFYFCSTTSPKHQSTTLPALGTPCETPSSRRQGRGIRRGLSELSARSMCSFKFDSEFHRRRACRAAQGHHASGGEPGAANQPPVCHREEKCSGRMLLDLLTYGNNSIQNAILISQLSMEGICQTRER